MKLNVKLFLFLHVSDSQNVLWTNNTDDKDNNGDNLLSAYQMPNTMLFTLFTSLKIL